MFEDFAAWLAARALRTKGTAMADTTLYAKRKRLALAARLAGADTEDRLADLLGDRRRVESLLDVLSTRHAPATFVNDVRVLVQFGQWATAKGWIETCAVRREDGPSNVPQPPIVVYTEAEIARLLLFAEARRNRRFFMLLATVVHTGRRVSEILNLQWDHVHLDGDVPHFDLPYTKNKRQAYVPLNAALRALWTPDRVGELRRLPTKADRDPAMWAFPTRYSTVTASLKRLCEVAGVPYRGWHCFRHTRATQLLAKGVPIQAVSAVLGHASVVTTDRIYHHATALDYARYLD